MTLENWCLLLVVDKDALPIVTRGAVLQLGENFEQHLVDLLMQDHGKASSEHKIGRASAKIHSKDARRVTCVHLRVM